MRSVLLVLGLVLAGLTPASAASFDCARASTHFEKAICAHPNLSQLDETLSVAYRTALGGLGDAATASVKKSQRDWLGYAQRACTDDARPATKAYDADGAQCLADVFGKRIDTLEKSRMFGRHRFYPVDFYRVRPDTEGGSWAKATTNTVSVVHIDADTALASGFNAMMDRQSAAARKSMNASGEGMDPGTTDTALDITPTTVTGRLITSQVVDYSYSHGAAHGNYAVTYLNYLTKEGRPLAADDVFAGSKWPKVLRERAFASLKARFGDSLFVDKSADLADAVTDPERWQLKNDGLHITFEPYEVTAYAAGAPEVTLDWGDLDPYLARNANRIIYGY